MKRKILSLFLGSIILSGAVYGCGQDITSENVSDVSISTTESVVASVSAEATEELTAESQAGVQSEFDFIKAVESTYICGQQLSFPLTWGQFGEDFLIDYESVSVDSKEQNVSAFVRYKGYDVGIFGFTGCDSVDAINADTIIRSITVLSKDVDFFGTEKITVSDLSLGIDHSRLFNTLGDGYREGIGYDQIIYENDIGKYIFTFSPTDDEDMLTSINILNLAK